MPRAATPSSRSRRSARQSKATPSKRPAVQVPQGSFREVKGEPNEPTLDDTQLTITIPPRSKPPPILLNRRRPWKHPDELEYIRPDDWDEDRIIGYLCKKGFSIPPRLSHAQSPWCGITDRNGETTIVPRGYRLPLMFAAKFQWESLRLVMTSATRNEEWDDYKFDILHVSRLCNGFMEQAKAAMSRSGMDKSWRCPMFDRALTRYYRRWLVNREEFVKDFWLEYKEEEYERDILKADWTRFVMKGHKGFNLTREEINKGITFDEFTHGLSFIRGRLNWDANPESGESRQVSQAVESNLEKPEGTSKRPRSSLDSDDARFWDSAVAHSTSPPPHDDAIVRSDARLSPAAVAVKLEQMVDDPNFFTFGSSTNEIIIIPSTPDYYPSPVTDTEEAAADRTAAAKPMDIEPACTHMNNPDDLYVPSVSTKAIDPTPAVEDIIAQTLGEDTPNNEPYVLEPPPEPTVNGVSLADVVVPEEDLIVPIEGGSEAVDLSPDVEMGSVEETSTPAKDKNRNNAMNQDSCPPSPVKDSPAFPAEEITVPHQPLFPPSVFEILTPPGGFIMKGLTGRTSSMEPRQSEPSPLADVEMEAGSSHASRPEASSESSQPSSRHSKESSEQPSSPDKKLSAWDARVHAALQRAQKLSKPPRTLGDKEAEGADEPAHRGPSSDVELSVIGVSLQRPAVQLPGPENVPRAQSSTPSGSSTAVPASSVTGVSVSPDSSMETPMETRSEIAAGKARQVEQESTEEHHDERQTPAKRAREPSSPVDIEMTDVEPMSISHAPRLPSRRPEPSRHAFVTPNMSSSSVSTYRRGSRVGEDLGLSHHSSPVVRKVVSMFRETLEGLTDILDSVEREPMMGPSVYSRHEVWASASSSLPDSSLVGELLGEIKSLKRQMQENAERRSERDFEVLHLQSEVDDLRRHIVRIDSRSRMSTDVDEPIALASPSASSSTFSSPIHRRFPEPEPEPEPAPTYSSHPLAHLLAMDLEDPPPESSRAASTSANASSWSTPDISTPAPFPRPSSPHDDVPLPIKSQRKHRMMFFPPPKQP